MNSILCFLVFYPIIAGLLLYLVGRWNKTVRDYGTQFVTVTEALIFLVLLVQYLSGGFSSDVSMLRGEIPGFCGFGLHFTLDGFRILYGMIASFMWAMTNLLSKEYFAHYRNRNRYYLFMLLTLGATIGVFLSADLYTTFIFFEMMSFTSYIWVAHDEKKDSLRAAETYLAVAVIGGLVMLMGIFLLYSLLGTFWIADLLPAVEAAKEGLSAEKLSAFQTKLYAAGGCMLFGFGAKAGMFPLHIWLPKAHPVAPAPSSALLSGILTKAGMFGILILSCNIFFRDGIWGSLILLLGVCTMVVGAVLALFSVNLKRTLASSSVSQIGFILVGVGMNCLLGDENALAARGALLHMVNHSLIKLVLFMAAGVVFMNLHDLELNKIRGFGRKKPLLNFSFLMGALGIGGIPLWNGYISKTLIHESIVEYTEALMEGHMETIWFNATMMKAIEWSFLISGGLTVAYMMKLYVCLFIEKNESEKEQLRFDGMAKTYAGIEAKLALVLSAILLPVMGFFPGIVMNKMADLGQAFVGVLEMPEFVHYFSGTNLKGGLTSIAIGILLYFCVVRTCLMWKNRDGIKVYVDKWPLWLDLENMIYRPLLLSILPFVFGVLCRILDSFVDGLIVLLRKTIYRDSPLPHELEEGNFITHFFGSIADADAKVYYKLAHKLKNPSTSLEHRLALWYDDMSENRTIIVRSMSFGLMLFCIGMMLTIIYLLFL